MSGCRLCPRNCGADRSIGERGVCGEGKPMRISRIALHPFEEPPISGKLGSGTVFFCGCSLKCVFCQNRDISHGEAKGKFYTSEQLAAELLRLRDGGATNINLVTPTHFADEIAVALRLVKDVLGIPVLYNTSGYESIETLKKLEGLVDIYMPDFKYMSFELAAKYSSAPDYPDVVQAALKEMYRQVGVCRFDESGILLSGMIVRHLVLPGARRDSIAVLERLANILPVDDILLSLMSQYTPDFARECEFKELHRKITAFEYDTVVDAAMRLGFDGFIQSRVSAVTDYTPKFK